MHANFPPEKVEDKGNRIAANAVIAAIILMALRLFDAKELNVLARCMISLPMQMHLTPAKFRRLNVTRTAFDESTKESFVSLFRECNSASLGTRRFEIQIFKLPQNRKVWQVPSKCSRRKFPS